MESIKTVLGLNKILFQKFFGCYLSSEDGGITVKLADPEFLIIALT